jgi:flavin reductase (DIM6/NTAB) family NADH-FMN oxidoreductase RutF
MIRKELTEINVNPFELFKKGNILLTAGDLNNRNSMTIGWGTIGYLFRKNVVIVYVKESRYTKHLMDESEYFSISFLSDKYKKELAIMGSKSGKDIDKYKETNLHLVYDIDKKVSYIKESYLVFKLKKISNLKFDYDHIYDCDIVKNYYSGSEENNFHTMYIGEIVSCLVSENEN